MKVEPSPVMGLNGARMTATRLSFSASICRTAALSLSTFIAERVY